ncbi:hypothetical protein LP422_06430 [Janibacter limosus]|uniref:hypothetical protein n=1 Tax=Janibacter limosus TaxID=53458 RepID=UPI0035D9D7AA|nr:hypothetical protein LP422_06430 [Janibacter limosus]
MQPALGRDRPRHAGALTDDVGRGAVDGHPAAAVGLRDHDARAARDAHDPLGADLPQAGRGAAVHGLPEDVGPLVADDIGVGHPLAGRLGLRDLPGPQVERGVVVDDAVLAVPAQLIGDVDGAVAVGEGKRSGPRDPVLVPLDHAGAHRASGQHVGAVLDVGVSDDAAVVEAIQSPHDDLAVIDPGRVHSLRSTR